jgi:sulfonate transport system ATP-binding protein
VLIEDHRIVLDEPVLLPRPRARGAAFDAIEDRVLQRVLSKPGEEAAPTVQRILPASEWRWPV